MITEIIIANIRLTSSTKPTIRDTQKKLAKMVNVSPETITQYCTTQKLPKSDTFALLCKALDVSADYILGLREF